MHLKAGPVHLNYEKGFLRTMTVDGLEVLRMIYFALRNRDWNTAHVEILNETVHAQADSFGITYDWQTDDLGMHMAGNVRLEGQVDGTIIVDFYGRATADFWRNRVGLCVLHPIQGLAGQPCVIDSPDGRTTTGVFPHLIAPYQPFLQVQTMRWQLASRQYRVDFSGDVFETEDQRNWTDASYKTYSTPLDQPYPVDVRAGTEVSQRVVFRPEELSAPQSPVYVIAQTEMKPEEEYCQNTTLRIGLGHRPDGPALTTDEAQLLQRIGLSHLRADVWLSDAHWQANLHKAVRDAHLLGLPLELAAFWGADAAAEARLLSEFVRNQRVPLYSILLFQESTSTTTDQLLDRIVPLLRHDLPGVLLGGGTDGNFVDLNRHRFNFGQVDFVTYSINPQVHASDNQTILENVAGQADTVRSARALSGDKPVHISPVTLLPRYNPDAAPSGARDVPPIDPRLSTDFGAEWTRQSIQTLTEAGAASVTYYETHGPRGLVNGSEAYPLLDVLRSIR